MLARVQLTGAGVPGGAKTGPAPGAALWPCGNDSKRSRAWVGADHRRAARCRAAKKLSGEARVVAVPPPSVDGQRHVQRPRCMLLLDLGRAHTRRWRAHCHACGGAREHTRVPEANGWMVPARRRSSERPAWRVAEGAVEDGRTLAVRQFMLAPVASVMCLRACMQARGLPKMRRGGSKGRTTRGAWARGRVAGWKQGRRQGRGGACIASAQCRHGSSRRSKSDGASCRRHRQFI